MNAPLPPSDDEDNLDVGVLKSSFPKMKLPGKDRVCGACGENGHNSNTCNNKRSSYIVAKEPYTKQVNKMKQLPPAMWAQLAEGGKSPMGTVDAGIHFRSSFGELTNIMANIDDEGSGDDDDYQNEDASDSDGDDGHMDDNGYNDNDSNNNDNDNDYDSNNNNNNNNEMRDRSGTKSRRAEVGGGGVGSGSGSGSGGLLRSPYRGVVGSPPKEKKITQAHDKTRMSSSVMDMFRGHHLRNVPPPTSNNASVHQGPFHPPPQLHPPTPTGDEDTDRMAMCEWDTRFRSQQMSQDDDT